MTRSAAPVIVAQALLLVGIGAALGVADAFIRPVTITRAAPPPLQLPATGTAAARAPAVTTPPTPPPPTAQAAPQPSAAAAPVTPTPPTSTPAPASPSPSPPRATACTPTPKDKLPPGHITLDEAKALFDGGQAIFVDTRKKDIYQEGHVKSAYRIELHDFAAGDPQILNFIERSSTVITYCVGGNCDESEAVAKQLTGAGYTKTYVMHDGFPCWQALGYPIETGAGAFP